MRIVILGCGRVGARLALLMEEDGHEVSIIDSDPASLERLPSHFKGRTTLGTGIDVDVLKAAGIEGADAFAAVTNFDNTNIMACQVAKEIFGVKKVLARIYDPGRENLYHHLGLETVCPTTLISTTARDILVAPEGVEVSQLPPDTEAAQAASALTSASTGPSVVATNNALSTQVSGPNTQAIQTVQSSNKEDDKGQNNGRGLRGLFRH